MTITDEPGVYETDEVGIRIENELECVDAGTNQYGHWLKFEPLTLVPISTEPVIVDELTRDQINWRTQENGKYNLNIKLNKIQ